MIAVAIAFPSGRFHATPWGRHVNEAALEWPPSPWRILRAVVATWKRKFDEDDRLTPAVIESLLRKLADPPLFVLPPATPGHVRHFMPWFKKGPSDRTLVFDGFICMEKHQEVHCLWPKATLDPTERLALELLAAHIGFLGRAESWVECRVLEDDEAEAALGKVNCMPMEEKPHTSGYDPVRILCPDASTVFGNDHTPKKRLIEGRGKSRKTIDVPLYDPDWHLCMETFELHAKRWSNPPGAQWITYCRAKDCFATSAAPPHIEKNRMAPTIARFALDSTVLPLVEETLPVAELARRTVMGIFRRIEEKRHHLGNETGGKILPRSEVFSGKDADGNALQGHRHAYYLPTDEDDDGRIDHLTIVASMGFGPPEMRVLDALRKLKREDGDPLNLVLLAIGQTPEIFAPKLLGPSEVWISATPFLATRFQKPYGRKRDPAELLGAENRRKFARQVLVEEFSRERPELPEPIAVDFLNEENRCGAHGLRPIQFKRYRQKRGDDGGRRANGVFQIVFPEPVLGPICFGHSSHFGMGLFIPRPQTAPS